MTRLALICDFREEGWHSMNLVADQTYASLLASASRIVEPARVRPAMVMLASRLARVPGRHLRNLDRLVNRFLHYPVHVRRLRERFDLFHLMDHSYSHLVHELPANRTIVTCHDLDTFRSVLAPGEEPRSWAFRRMTERILEGFRKAAHVVCVSQTTRDELVHCRITPAARISVIHNGLNPVFKATADPQADRELENFLPADPNTIELLHVGSTIPRKRIDLLLEIVARVKAQFPSLRLLRAGGRLTDEQAALARRLGVDSAIVELPYLDERVLASLYRRVAVVVQTSEAEGFGLPVAEALACGAIVVASDIPVLREIGGAAARYCPVGEVWEWQHEICRLIEVHQDAPEQWRRLRLDGVNQAAGFRWDVAAFRLQQLYSNLQTAL